MELALKASRKRRATFFCRLIFCWSSTFVLSAISSIRRSAALVYIRSMPLIGICHHMYRAHRLSMVSFTHVDVTWHRCKHEGQR